MQKGTLNELFIECLVYGNQYKTTFPKYFPKSPVKYILFNDAFEESQFLGKNVGKR